MVNRMHPYAYTWRSFRYIVNSFLCLINKGYNHIYMVNLTTDGCAIFTIECDIKHAGTQLLDHLGLQRQRLAHAHLHAAVVVTHRQYHFASLRP